MDDFTRANRTLQAQLRYHLDPEHSDEFRGLLQLAGWKRFSLAVTLVGLRNLRSGALRHEAVMAQMRALIPAKRSGTKYRNPQRQAAEGVHREMDRQMEVAIARDRE